MWLVKSLICPLYYYSCESCYKIPVACGKKTKDPHQSIHEGYGLTAVEDVDAKCGSAAARITSMLGNRGPTPPGYQPHRGGTQPQTGPWSGLQ